MRLVGFTVALPPLIEGFSPFFSSVERPAPPRTARIFENISELSKSDRPSVPMLIGGRERCKEGLADFAGGLR